MNKSVDERVDELEARIAALEGHTHEYRDRSSLGKSIRLITGVAQMEDE